MLQLEMPHINVLSKIDLLGSFENLRELSAFPMNSHTGF
jgi:hypothetical protein